MFDKLDLLFDKIMNWEGNSPSRRAFIAAVFMLGIPCLITFSGCFIITSLGMALCILSLVGQYVS